jgi:hypothetical protein
LPHCRRKLFFEWRDAKNTVNLIPFSFIEEYLQLLQSDKSLQDRLKHELIRGLNRAFSRLYVSDSSHLYVTSHYAQAVERPMPVIQLSIPDDNIELVFHPTSDDAYDYDKRDLLLKISPPPRAKDHKSISWPIDLLRFEYLMRLAQGGTYNILADECELAVRQLRETLLIKFAIDADERGYITFFVSENNRYIAKKLWVNEKDKKIQIGGD